MKPRIDDACLQLAARVLRRQVKQLTRQVEGIRKAEDIEFVHRARVASRRLRTALGVFADFFPADRVESWRQQTRRVGRGLGEARDMDVQIEFLRDVLGRLPDRAYGPGVARVLVHCERQREKLQPRVLKAMSRLLASRALHQMLAATRKYVPDDNAELPLPTPLLFEHAERHILGRHDELQAYSVCLADPEDYERHHGMRIAAKRLRYTMEIYKPVYAGRLEVLLETMKQVQTLLGDIHDCDVRVEQLGRSLQKQSKRMQRFYGHAGPLAGLTIGVDYLQRDRQQRRRELFGQLVEYWQRLSRDGYWEELARLVRRRGTAAAAEPAGEGTAVVSGAQSTASSPPPAAAAAGRPILGPSTEIPEGRRAEPRAEPRPAAARHGVGAVGHGDHPAHGLPHIGRGDPTRRPAEVAARSEQGEAG